MITNRGRDIIARTLAGQVPSAFSYLAIGCGETPVAVGTAEDAGIAAKTLLNFETLRVPVSAASVVFEGGQTKIVLAGTIPSDQRYGISEIGVFSAENNSLLVTEPPRLIYSFSNFENWEYHASGGVEDIVYVGSMSTNEADIESAALPVEANPKCFFISAEDSVFYAADRQNQAMRVYQDAFMVRGDASSINDSGATWTFTGEHIHVANIPVDITKARPDDEIKIAFSVMNAVYADIANATVPDKVQIAVQFLESETSSEYAAMQVEVQDNDLAVSGQYPEDTDFEQNGYYVVAKRKDELVTTSNFSWENVTMARVWVEVVPKTGTADDYYVALDALRFDSLNDNNPAYGLVAYSVVQDNSLEPKIKLAQVESQVEYKLALEVS